MTAINIYQAAFILTGKNNKLDQIELIGDKPYYHVSGLSIEYMKKRYHRRNLSVGLHYFLETYEWLKEKTEKEIAKQKQADEGGEV